MSSLNNLTTQLTKDEQTRQKNTFNEIGGYLGLDLMQTFPFHKGGVYLNTARNALKYIIQVNQITKIAIPYFTCNVIHECVLEEDCEIVFYDINKNLEPQLHDLENNMHILVNNYFGIRTRYLKNLAQKYPNIIIDNAQAFYAPPYGFASFYSPRKFFGLPDGGIVFNNSSDKLDLAQDTSSYSRCSHLLKRHDLGAQASYRDFIENEASLNNQPILKMSNLTQLLMGNINYADTAKIRRKNYLFLHQNLKEINLLHCDLDDDDVPLVYPLVIENQSLRNKLISNHIFVATYWPNIKLPKLHDNTTQYFQQYLVPLPIDQRYTQTDMFKIIQNIKHTLITNTDTLSKENL